MGKNRTDRSTERNGSLEQEDSGVTRASIKTTGQVIMEIISQEYTGGYQLYLESRAYIYFDDIKDWGGNVMLIVKGHPSGGLWPPQYEEFLKLWGEI